MTIRAVILDLNGTLVESASQSLYMGQLLAEWVQENNMDPGIAEEYRNQIPVKSFRGFLKGFDIPWEDLHDWVGRNYEPSQWLEAPGATVTLKKLSRHYKLGIISNSKASFVWKLLDYLGWRRLLGYVGTREVAIKPNVEAFNLALHELQITAAESVAIGNKEKDIFPLEGLGGFGIKCSYLQIQSIPKWIAARQFRERNINSV